MKKFRYIAYSILIFALTLIPNSFVSAETITNAGAPFSHHMDFSWWVILTFVLAGVGTISLTTFLIVQHIKNKKNSQNNTDNK